MMMKCHESLKNANRERLALVNKNQVRQKKSSPGFVKHTHIQITHAWKETIHQNINNDYTYVKFMDDFFQYFLMNKHALLKDSKVS